MSCNHPESIMSLIIYVYHYITRQNDSVCIPIRCRRHNCVAGSAISASRGLGDDRHILDSVKKTRTHTDRHLHFTSSSCTAECRITKRYGRRGSNTRMVIDIFVSPSTKQKLKTCSPKEMSGSSLKR